MTLTGTLICASPSDAYRPFVSTDAAVADRGGVEMELGYFGAEYEHGRNVYVVPHAVLNSGLVDDVEVVGEFSIEEPPDEQPGVADPSVSLKAVLKEGALQEQEGMSVAIEAGPLLPGTIDGKKGFGFEAIGILSGELQPITYHVNLGGGVDRSGPDPFAIWGIIGELSVVSGLRLVGEVNGEETRRVRGDNSALIGLIYRPPSFDASFDLGIRKGFAGAALDWGITAGVTFSHGPVLVRSQQSF